MPPRNFVPIRRKLLSWYGKNKRDLPWRKTDDPYAIWIAETMLQQTQVATVVAYYDRFLHKFPSVEALARASLDRILAHWSGLGYYRRAENLKKAARQIIREYGGRIPANYDQLRSLAGVGDYTAGALLSIAFHKPYPAVDGNVRRVLGRLFGLKNERELRAAARQLIPRSSPGYFNQGLMELGATLCAPTEPRCPRCPLAPHCASRGTKALAATKLALGRKPKFKELLWPVAIVRSNGKILIRRRSNTGLLARLWELPGGKNPAHENPQVTIRRHLGEWGKPIPSMHVIGEIRHSMTHWRIRAPVFLCDLPSGEAKRPPGRHWRWVHASTLRRHPVTTMTLKAAEFLAAYEENSL